MTETLPRLAKDTRLAPYWRGRCVREYVGSALRQFQQGRAAMAFSRIGACCRLAFPHSFLPQFWSGLWRREESKDVSPIIMEPITSDSDYSEKTVRETNKTGAEILPAKLPQ